MSAAFAEGPRIGNSGGELALGDEGEDDSEKAYQRIAKCLALHTR